MPWSTGVRMGENGGQSWIADGYTHAAGSWRGRGDWDRGHLTADLSR
jgi:hypothetical protein